MENPNILEKLNKYAIIISGGLLFIIASLTTMEVFMRYIVGNPTIWSTDISRYLLIWSIFLAAAYGFQEKGHVSVDFVRQAIGEKNFLLQRILTIVGYLVTLFFIVALCWRSTLMVKSAISLGRVTQAYIEIPVAYLYISIVLGSFLMLATVILIIIRLIKGDTKYL